MALYLYLGRFGGWHEVQSEDLLGFSMGFLARSDAHRHVAVICCNLKSSVIIFLLHEKSLACRKNIVYVNKIIIIYVYKMAHKIVFGHAKQIRLKNIFIPKYKVLYNTCFYFISLPPNWRDTMKWHHQMWLHFMKFSTLFIFIAEVGLVMLALRSRLYDKSNDFK